MKHTVILDIGKTHIKLYLKNDLENTLQSRVKSNQVTTSGLYPHFDVDAIWDWLVTTLREWTTEHRGLQITALAITTHGATAALIDRHSEGNGLVLPVLDYEFDGLDGSAPAYDKVRPAFDETGSPLLPAGLNLGKQLFWQQQRYPEAFAKATDILTYPQYWAWRFTQQRCSEVTSLGCHTDLWNPRQKCFSSLVETLAWQDLFPPLKNAYDVIGQIHPDIQAQTGLSELCQVFVGIHDSNASYYRYKTLLKSQPFTVLSTGTWCIAMKNQHRTVNETALPTLEDARDMLINVDATGAPVICSRFMAGREMENLCDALEGDIAQPYTLENVQTLVASGCYCTPSWVAGTGPFPEAQGRIQGIQPPHSPASALASLYLALMIDVQLELVQAQGSIVLEGSYVKNPHLCALLASLRPEQVVYTSTDSAGTVAGTYMLTMPDTDNANIALTHIKAISIPGLPAYKAQWRSMIG
ncbi:hypothetical protein G8770_14590 [Aestuariicella hydrocarbonica]|uniref:L-fuculose kinase n=1 Tax=Pseudomaricurvus hydrocarbonicus TaxID=1470433 RepID=A0A9E5JXI9_9GAMM|nr:FGGY family carbohydrate kinase [Aestuariicella hydrocarbonica]NHO66775.1 hypothetical protein [Aestuariicella hydrocarbonica]